MTDDELIMKVAEEVMGWTLYRSDGEGVLYTNGSKYYWLSYGHPRFCWNPLTDVSDAWMVVEKMRELGFTLKLGHGNTVKGILTWAGFSSESYKSYHHNEQPGRAICLAALEAVRGEEVETINN